MSPSELPKVALLDADILTYRIGFASEDETEQVALARVKEVVLEIVYNDLECDDYMAYITGANNFRKDIAVTAPYKGNRKEVAKPKHYHAIREHLVRLGATLVDGMEADDAIAIKAQEGNYWICSIDKDLDQLEGWHYNFVKKEKYYVTNWQGLVSFYSQILTGDRIDNVVGLKGIGPVKAAKILQDCKTEKELYDACLKAYNGDEARVIENARLLWLLRTPQQVWSPPLSLQDSSGGSSTQTTSASTDSATPQRKKSRSKRG